MSVLCVCVFCLSFTLLYYYFTKHERLSFSLLLLPIRTHYHHIIYPFLYSYLPGAIFATDSIELANVPDGVRVDLEPGTTATPPDYKLQFAGDRQLRFMPVGDPAYFLHGQCTATSGVYEPFVAIRNIAEPTATNRDVKIPQPVITSQSCKLNLCLGGGGFSCIAIYSGSAFVFNLGEGVVNNNALTRTSTGNAPNDAAKLTNVPPPLPPAFRISFLFCSSSLFLTFIELKELVPLKVLKGLLLLQQLQELRVQLFNQEEVLIKLWDFLMLVSVRFRSSLKVRLSK